MWYIHTIEYYSDIKKKNEILPFAATWMVAITCFKLLTVYRMWYGFPGGILVKIHLPKQEVQETWV